VDLATVKAVILGVIQGLTEFLPVSSSGHLVLSQHLFGIKKPEVFFDVVLHLGTLTAVCLVFRRDIAALAAELLHLPKVVRGRDSLAAAWRERPNFRLLVLILAGTIPTGLIGFIFQDFLESLFASTFAVGLALLVTGLILFLTRLIKDGGRGITGFRAVDALLIGLAQGLAITPGISRSGFTISTGLFLGLDRELAARYSFLLSIPAILGALIIQFEGVAASSFDLLAFGLGFLAAVISGWLAIILLLKIVRRGDLHYFAYYCWLVGLVTLGLTIYGISG